MCHEANVVLAYLSLYSPNYNPIEKSFSGLKAWMKRHKALAKGYEGKFPGFIRMTVQEYNAEGNAEAHFCNSFVNCT